MIDYILDNMVVNLRSTHIAARCLRENNMIDYTICEEIAHEQRLAPQEYRRLIKNESRSIDDVTNMALLADIANEMVDNGVLDLDEGGGDVLVAYEITVDKPQNMFVSERIVVTDDHGLRNYCDRHDKHWISSAQYSEVISRDGVADE